MSRLAAAETGAGRGSPRRVPVTHRLRLKDSFLLGFFFGDLLPSEAAPVTKGDRKGPILDIFRVASRLGFFSSFFGEANLGHVCAMRHDDEVVGVFCVFVSTCTGKIARREKIKAPRFLLHISPSRCEKLFGFTCWWKYPRAPPPQFIVGGNCVQRWKAVGKCDEKTGEKKNIAHDG